MNKNEMIYAIASMVSEYVNENEVPVGIMAAAGLAITDIAVQMYEGHEEERQRELPQVLEVAAGLAVEWSDSLNNDSRVLN